ncbi:endonuclease [Micromonospora endolithica]|uniref:Endonuclease n=1 Tax=Micromonospora endolithica TaxID=230091 RepID=A0A3A9ZQJ1_9ACTN|nr:endonuclease [Micromonospora endolithica]RKN50443.1 endonuclease [Micromonospora endolithica]TWJ20872.1 exonuclease III [Micromonospora endolithica]
MLSILTINVQAAALARAQNLLTWLLQRDDHLVILTETSNGPGTRHPAPAHRPARSRVVHHAPALARRRPRLCHRQPHPTRPAPHLTAGISLPGRAPALTLDTDPAVTILGLYVPSSDRAPAKLAKKRTFLTTVTDTLTRLPTTDRTHLVVGGDYNVISRDHQPRYPGFRPFEYDFLDALTALGLTDVHRTLYPDVQAHSWIGRAGNGYRFDYLHAGPGLLPHLAAATYLKQPRLEGLTDHCAHSADIDIRRACGRGAGTGNAEARLTSRTYS